MGLKKGRWVDLIEKEVIELPDETPVHIVAAVSQAISLRRLADVAESYHLDKHGSAWVYRSLREHEKSERSS